MQLYLGGLHGRTVTKSHFGRNSQKRAIAWGVAEGAHWRALEIVSRTIRNHVRRQAVAHVPGRPILPGAAALWQQGYFLKEAAKAPYHWEPEGLRPDA